MWEKGEEGLGDWNDRIREVGGNGRRKEATKKGEGCGKREKRDWRTGMTE